MIGVILKSKAFLEDLEELEKIIVERKKSPSEKLGLSMVNDEQILYYLFH